MTLGEYRVGLSFNPSANPMVDKVKRQAADLIDLLEANIAELYKQNDPETAQEMYRLTELAKDAVETAAMHGVKAATKRPME